MKRERQGENRKQAPIVKEIWIAAHPETVFSFLTEPKKFVRWLGRSAELDPRPGGIFRIDVNGRDVVRGEFIEVVPNRKVVFTWGWEGEGSAVPPGSTTVEISLEPDGEGTRVRLSHAGLPEEPRRKHAEGWVHYMSRLGLVARGGDPGLDPLGTPETRHG
jgi:uncharacterized protein YndB with AHSA1/START domain